MRLSDKVTLITGGGSGIGRAVVLRFLQEGAYVAFCDRDRAAGERVLEEAAGTPLFVPADVTDPDSVAGLVERVREHFGRIDALVNIAGVNRDAPVDRLDDAAFEEVIQVNLSGTFHCCQAVLPGMRAQQSGRILTTASVSALGNIGQANYSAAKAGIIGLTKTLALECARDHITVNCVAPGFTRTRMTEALPEKLREKFLAKIPLGRFARPEEIAGMYVFLASEEAAYCTGQVFFMDGGLTVGF